MEGASLSIARLDLTAPGAAAAVAAALEGGGAADPASLRPPVAALIDAVGLRDLAVPESAIRAVLTKGTAALWSGAVAARVPRFLAVAGGIHRTAEGAPRRDMVHNAAREDALDAAAAEARAAGCPTALTILDPSVYFKDAAAIFRMVARSQPPSLTLIKGGWGVLCNPISGRDLAGALVAVALSPLAARGGGVERFSVGGPEVLTFGELADKAAVALAGGDPAAACRRVTLPRWVARTVWRLAAAAGAAGSKRALGLARFLSFLWVVCTDESPRGLVGELREGQDRVAELFEELAAEERAKAAGRL